MLFVMAVVAGPALVAGALQLARKRDALSAMCAAGLCAFGGGQRRIRFSRGCGLVCRRSRPGCFFQLLQSLFQCLDSPLVVATQLFHFLAKRIDFRIGLFLGLGLGRG